MRALHFLIIANNADTSATPSAVATPLKMATASTTKLLDI